MVLDSNNDPGGHRPEISNRVADHRQAYQALTHLTCVQRLIAQVLVHRDAQGNIVKAFRLGG